MTHAQSTFPINYLKKQAKQLLQQVEAGNISSLARVSTVLKDLSDFSLMKAQTLLQSSMISQNGKS